MDVASKLLLFFIFVKFNIWLGCVLKKCIDTARKTKQMPFLNSILSQKDTKNWDSIGFIEPVKYSFKINNDLLLSLHAGKQKPTKKTIKYTNVFDFARWQQVFQQTREQTITL